ncbi:hypothetical protein Rhe02_54760 [Rhizocola hellebori]|uniref:Uncharacterized protein n=1 Tax=Rhizocola hellebori TaxID=1392758 RepID=A0A8J3QAW1_9ACTN|nr:hypothetical protein [Rhizocola hellebori]GIH07409.1 hypothetical protein Rhe02_54760 [Rhizocola hellebori]
MTVLDRVPVEAITAKAHSVRKVDWARVRRAFVALLALPLTWLGWTARAVVSALVTTKRAAWFAVTWACSAVVVGWESGPSSARMPEGD